MWYIPLGFKVFTIFHFHVISPWFYYGQVNTFSSNQVHLGLKMKRHKSKAPRLHRMAPTQFVLSSGTTCTEAASVNWMFIWRVRTFLIHPRSRSGVSMVTKVKAGTKLSSLLLTVIRSEYVLYHILYLMFSLFKHC